MTLGFDTFRFKQLIFVNSAAYAYTRVRIDQHTALFGSNNLGKTSMLNALKLFLLPEINFRNCQKKFNFRGTNGKVYDSLASFRYYFPEDRSFITLEAENPHGTFCIVLHRGGATDNQEYARMVVPCAYSEIEPLLWDMDADDDSGIGGPVEAMTLKDTLAELRRLGGEPLSERKTIQQRLFTSQPHHPTAGRFSLLPLRNDAGAREIEAWRKLIHLAFDIAAQDQRTLPDTLATIMEGQKSRKQEQLDVDISNIVDEARKLRADGDRITRLANAQDEWQTFDTLYQSERDHRRLAAQRYADLARSVTLEKDRLDEAVRLAGGELRDAANAEEALRRDKSTLEHSVTQHETRLEGLQQQAHRLRHSINAANATLNAFPGLTPDEAAAALQERIDQQQAMIDSYDSKEAAQRQLANVNRRLEGNKRKARQMRHALDNHSPTLLDALPARDAGVLYSLNPALGTTHGTPSPEQLAAFRHFSEQFYADSGVLVLGHPPNHITLGGINWQAYDAEHNRQQAEHELAQLEHHIERDSEQREELMRAATLTAEEVRRHRQDAAEAAENTRRERSTLMAKAANEDQATTLTDDIDTLSQTLEEARQQRNRNATEHARADEARQTAQQRHNNAKGERDILENLERRLNALGRDADSIFGHAHRHLEPEPCSLNDDAITALENDVRELRGQWQQLETQLRQLLARRLLGDDASADMTMAFNDQAVSHFHEQLRERYSNLETLRAHYRHNVERHNMTTHSQVEILRRAKDYVSAFMSGINKELGQFRISNLEEVRIDYRLHPRFQQLLDDLDRADLLGNELQDEHVYEQLQAFQADFFSPEASRTGSVLSMDQILHSVFYRYRLQGEDGWTGNAQSNGTTMMITTNLLSVLISRLMAPDARVSMPLVMDEFGSLEVRNMRTAREMAECHGYSLFVASPNRDANIIQVLENYVHLGLFNAERAYSSKRSVVHHGLCESFGATGSLRRRQSLPEGLPS